MSLVPIPTACGGAYLVLLLSVECLCRVQAPQARARPHQAVLHGGGWNNNTLNVRAPNRNRNAPANRNDNSGLRCAKTPRSVGVEASESSRLRTWGACVVESIGLVLCSRARLCPGAE